MHLTFIYPTLLALLTFSDTTTALRKPANSVLLTSVKTLTLRNDAKTSHRRVSSIPQLKCVGGSGRGHYEVDIMRCKNQGSDYDDDNVQWSCTASLPDEFRLGSTDVICEGYDSPNDPYILKGSCGVEYRLVLTDKGEEKYGRGSYFGESESGWPGMFFGLIFVGVAVWILYSMYLAWQVPPAARQPPRQGRFWGGGWGGGPGGGGGDPYDPPPPYPGKPYGTRAVPVQEGWRPGFWSGALGGAAAGYMVGNRGQQQPPQRNGWFDGSSSNGWGAGPRRPATRSSSSSSARHESTGFGSTTRR
jgi:hypothetical protein